MHRKLLFAVAALFTASALAACASPAAVPSPAQTESAAQTTLPAPTESATQTVEPSASPVVARISPAEAYPNLQAVVLLDVRTAEEFTQAHIPGAYLLPVDEIDVRAKAELPTDKPIYIYCRTGRRSAIAAQALAALGYTLLYDLGGIVDWPYETETGDFVPWNLIDPSAVVPVQLLDEGEVIPDDDEAEMPDLCGTGGECE